MNAAPQLQLPLLGEAIASAATLPATYPHVAGFKAAGTSSQAAQRIAGTVGAAHCRILELLADPEIRWGGLTPDEVAARMGRSVLYVRPRVSELLALGKLIPTGARRKNSSRLSAGVVRLPGLPMKPELSTACDPTNNNEKDGNNAT